MLSRVANSLYWMSRYLERAENTARLVDANLQIILDIPNLNTDILERHWRPIVQSSGDSALFDQLHPCVTSEAVTQFFVFQPENTNSVLSVINQARENARMVRDQITVEFWEELNRLYLFLQSREARKLIRSSSAEFFQEIKSASLLLQGMTNAIVVRNEGWNFIQVGKYLERADKTSRMLDSSEVHPAEESGSSLPTPADARAWSATLRACNAWDAYQSEYGTEIQPEKVREMLLLSENFPRSIRFCIEHLNTALRRISGVPDRRFSNDAERLAGLLLAQLQFSTVEDIFKTGLHTYVDLLQARLNDIGAALFNTYILHAFIEGENDRLRQQEEQQQQ